MGRITSLYQSTLGKKAVVAVTGIILFGFVILHMLGNLKTFTGVDAMGVPHVDIYARFLRTMGEPMLPHSLALWMTRIVLIVAFVVHVATTIDLARHSRAARPIHYTHRHQLTTTTPAARSMMITGLLLVVFVVIHILQFTTGTIDITPIVHEQVYANLYHAFREWFIVLFYVLAMILLAFHLFHGAWSLFQTLGLDNPDRNLALRLFAAGAAIALLVGFCAVPVLIFAGFVPPLGP